MEFDLIDDNSRVTIENIIITSVESYGLPKFLFFEEENGHASLYGKSVAFKDGQEVTTHIDIPPSLLSESIMRRLRYERDRYLNSR